MVAEFAKRGVSVTARWADPERSAVSFTTRDPGCGVTISLGYVAGHSLDVYPFDDDARMLRYQLDYQIACAKARAEVGAP